MHGTRDWDESKHPRVPAGSPGGGQFGEGGGGGAGVAEATTFVSPSTSSLTFDQAVAALDSPQQKALRVASGVIDLKLGIESTNRNTIGAWSDGAENSIMVTARGATPAEMRAASAMKGYIADQKQVLIFTPDRKASQYLASFDATTDNLGSLHDRLLKDGLAHHTLEPLAGGGVRVHVFGEGQKTLDAIGKAAKDYDATFKLSPGSGEFLGTELETGSDREQRDDARRVYENTIREIAAAGELRGGRDAGKIWDDVRDYWRTHAAEAPAEDAGGTGGGEAGRGGARSASEAQRSAAQAASGYPKLEGLPDKPIKVGDAWYAPGPIGIVKEAAANYMKSLGGEAGEAASHDLVSIARQHGDSAPKKFGPVTVDVYRRGALKDAGRGIFFGRSPVAVEGYQTSKPINKYRVEAKNAFIAKDHATLHEHLFDQSFIDAVEQEGLSGEAVQRVEAKMAAELRARGYDAVIYANTKQTGEPEIGVLDSSATIKEIKEGYDPPKTYQKVDKERATRIADAYEAMEHAPDDPAVKASYDALAKEVLAQWQFVKASGLKIEWIKPGQEDPYKTSLRMAAMDVIANNHLWVFPTDLGFGSGTQGAEAAKHDNPMLQPSGETVAGHPMLINDVFRIVHDYFGHFQDGVGFRADGEDNAWRDHASMFSKAALPALTTETRGQNSWLNFGPYAEHNRTANPTDTVYAPQKIGLLPEWAWNEGRTDPSKSMGGVIYKVREWDESKHPRVPGGQPGGGQFGESGGDDELGSQALGGEDRFTTASTRKVDALREEMGATDIPPKQRQALDLYTQDSYTFNQNARKEAAPANPETASLDKLIDGYKLPREMTVYRTIGWQRNQELLKHVGDSFSDPGFMSTTLDKSKIDKPSSYIEIQIPKGSHGFPVGSLSNFPEEAEILFPRNSRLEIVSHEPRSAPNTERFVARLVS
jgi:hypothetical protein